MVNSDGKAVHGYGKPVKDEEEALNSTKKALKGDGKNMKVDPKALKGNERRQMCHRDVKS